MLKISPLAPARFPKIPEIPGVTLTGQHVGLKADPKVKDMMLACLAPVWVLLLSGTLIGETVSRKAYIGLVLCLIGTATLIGSSFAFAPERLLGDLYGFATSIFFGLYFLAVRVARRKHQAGAVTFMSTSVTALVLLAITLLSGQGFLPQTIYGLSALLALGWVSHTFGQGLLAVALGALSAAFSSLVIFIVIIFVIFVRQ